MKKYVLSFVFMFSVFLVSCKDDFNLYADYKEFPVVYGLLDANADTNFIKITRAFYAQNDDATQVAMNPDSSNYPGKLDVRLVEYCNGDSVREIVFDTITICNKQPGIFFAPKQKLYFTTEKLNANTKTESYRYRLNAVLPDRVISSDQPIVGNGGFRIKSLAVNLAQEYFGTQRPLEFYPAINASSYDVSMSFTFREQRTPDGDSVPRTMYWNIGTYDEYNLANYIEDGYYRVTYRPERFHEMLRDFIGADTAVAGLTRFIGDYPVEIVIAAAGEMLTRYIETNSFDNQLLEGELDYEYVENAKGVFSSRMTTRRKVRLGGRTIPELIEMGWGFKFMGGEADSPSHLGHDDGGGDGCIE